ncbi:hypothetical protein pb186bvf_011605 [Paramecium bursaria]
MDQKIVDQLSIDSLPYYEDQLVSALQHLLELQTQLEDDAQERIVVRTQENQGNLYQYVQDVEEDNIDDVIDEIEMKHQEELYCIDDEQRQQDSSIYQLTQQLDELSEDVQQLKDNNQRDQEIVAQNKNIIKQKQNELQNIQFEILQQEFNNQQTQQLVKRKQKLLSQRQSELHEQLIQLEEEEETRVQNKYKKYDSMNSEITRLQSEKDTINSEINDLVDRKEAYINELQSRIAHTPESTVQELVPISERKETQEAEKKRGLCCGHDCIIF